jgi:hypothetical protein
LKKLTANPACKAVRLQQRLNELSIYREVFGFGAECDAAGRNLEFRLSSYVFTRRLQKGEYGG